MSDDNYIIVTGFIGRMTRSEIIRKLSWVIRGHFQLVAIVSGEKAAKKCYLKLSPRLNPHSVIKIVNEATFGNYKVVATACNEPVPLQKTKKRTVLPEPMRKKMHIPIELAPKQVILIVHDNLVKELEYKYTGLYNLSKRTNHKLMENICLIIADRLKKLASSFERIDSPFYFSRAYRVSYPYFGDFQLILSTLHAIEDAQAQPRSQINEKELSAVQTQILVDNIPADKIQDVCKKYSNRILKKVSNHLKNLDTNFEPGNPAEEAKIKVRQELKKLEPYLPDIVKGVVEKHFMPKYPVYKTVMIYGEPYMQNRATMEPFLLKYGVKKYERSDKMFNLVIVKVASHNYSRLLAQDGAVVGDCKLVIRGNDNMKYVIPDEIKQDLCKFLDAPAQDHEMEIN